ncbi:hypothetical protein SLEP1_g12996 [Rubroshorea leprosula]|uniref:Uncharacterized protein n=1 Tax=Rubroshorea leprosula TaxID=152421 RepID=A0AAV5IQR4_9ROSI|nr:hypothetical protein SLEP1_g12996 [Rubroshorea leprosula]
MMPGIYVDVVEENDVVKKKRVIHLTSAAQTGSGTSIDPFISSSAASSSSATGKPCDRCGYHSGLSGVISTCVDCFLGRDELCLFEYGVSIRYLLTRGSRRDLHHRFL